MYNCYYDDETRISLEQGPCAETLPTGARLVGEDTQSERVDVIEPAPVHWAPYALGLVALLFLSRKRGK